MGRKQEQTLEAEARFEVLETQDGKPTQLLVDGAVATVSAYTAKSARLRARQRFGNHVDVAQAA